MEKKRMDYVPMWMRYMPMFEKHNVSDAQLGALVWAMMRYQARDVEPVDLDEAMSVFWMFIREDINRARLKYEQAVENGRKGGRPKKNPEKPCKTPTNQKKGRTTTKTTSTSETTATPEAKTTTPDAACVDALSFSEIAYGEFGWVRLTRDQYRELESVMGAYELQRCISYIDRSAQTTGNRNQWQDWSLVLRRCYEGRWHEAAQKADPIPKGASGVLGPAELEAIQRVLREDTPAGMVI